MDPQFRLRSMMSSSMSSMSKMPNDEDLDVVQQAVTKWLNHHIRHHELYKDTHTGYAKLVSDACTDCSSAIPLLSVLEVLLDLRLTHLQWWLTTEEEEKDINSMFFVAAPDQKERLYPRVAPIYAWERTLNFSVLLSALERWGVDLSSLKQKCGVEGVEGINVRDVAAALVSTAGSIRFDGLLEVVKLMSLASLHPQFDCADVRECIELLSGIKHFFSTSFVAQTLRFHLENLIDPSAEENLQFCEVKALFSSEQHWTCFKQGLITEFDTNLETIEHVIDRSFASFGLSVPNTREVCSEHEELCFLIACDILRRCRFLVHRDLTDTGECEVLLQGELHDTQENVSSLMGALRLALSFWNVLVDESSDLPIAAYNMQGIYYMAQNVIERGDVQSMVELIFQFYNGLSGNATGSTIPMGKVSRAIAQVWGNDPIVVSAKYCSLKFKSFAEMLVRPALSSPNKRKQLTTACFQWVRRIIYTVESLRNRVDTTGIEDTTWQKTMTLRVLRSHGRDSSTSSQLSQSTVENPYERRAGSDEGGTNVSQTASTRFVKKRPRLRHRKHSRKSFPGTSRNDPIEHLVFAGDVEDIKLCCVDLLHDPNLVATIFAEVLRWKSALWQIFFAWAELGTPRVLRAASASCLSESKLTTKVGGKSAKSGNVSPVLAISRPADEQNDDGWPDFEVKDTTLTSPDSSSDTTSDGADAVKPDCLFSTSLVQKTADKGNRQAIDRGEQRCGNISSSPLRQSSMKSSHSPTAGAQRERSSSPPGEKPRLQEPTNISIEQSAFNKLPACSNLSPDREPSADRHRAFDGENIPVFSTATGYQNVKDSTGSPRMSAHGSSSTPIPATEMLTKVRQEAADEGMPNERNEATLTTHQRRSSLNSSGSSPLRECDENKSHGVSMNSMQSLIRNSRQAELEKNMRSDTFPSIPKKEASIKEQGNTEDDGKSALSKWILSFRSHVNKYHADHVHVKGTWENYDVQKQLCITLDSLLKVFKTSIAPPRIKRSFETVQNADPCISSYQIFNLSADDIFTTSKLREMVFKSGESPERSSRSREALSESCSVISPSSPQGVRPRGHSVSDSTRDRASISPLQAAYGESGPRGRSLSSSVGSEVNNDSFSFNEFVHFFLHLCLLECQTIDKVKETVRRFVYAASNMSPDGDPSGFS